MIWRIRSNKNNAIWEHSQDRDKQLIRSKNENVPSHCSHPQSSKATERIRFRTSLFGWSLNQRQHRRWIFSCPYEWKELQCLGCYFLPVWSLATLMDGHERQPARGSRFCSILLPSSSNRTILVWEDLCFSSIDWSSRFILSKIAASATVSCLDVTRKGWF